MNVSESAFECPFKREGDEDDDSEGDGLERAKLKEL